MAWFAWAVAATIVVELAPSPVYVAVVIALAWLVVEVHAPDGPYRRAFPILVAVGVVFTVVRVVLAALTTHTGLHVLVTVPHVTVPDLLGGFTIGGTIEAPVVLQAAAEGFTVVGVMAVFGTFNAVASHHELVQSSPRAFHELGLVTTVALAFVPATVESVGAVRDADRARTGGQARRGRLVRTVVPVLERGMERAVALSESMDARGFGCRAPTRATRAGWCGLAGLVALGGAFVALTGRATTAALGLGLLGALLVTAAIAAASRATGRPRYRARRLRRADWVMVAVSAAAPLAVALLAVAGVGSLTWAASPLRWPRFDPVVLLAIAPLLAPLARAPGVAWQPDPVIAPGVPA